MDEGNAELDRLVRERVEHLSATRGWPWQQPGVQSAALDSEGRVRRYLATDDGFIELGPA